MKVLVCGSRSWTSEHEIRSVLREFDRGTIVVHGGARGADQLAGVVARSLGMEVREHRPRYDRYPGALAPLIRNRHMLDTEKPDLVIAFWDGHSSGTRHCIDEAHKRNIPVLHGGAYRP
ncbi:MAG TPA: SLOG family protein [Candidatus Binatus sp.]|nr:SLOG family protein [Candidatus Binatus sp.]